jgi:hypothetical protein
MTGWKELSKKRRIFLLVLLGASLCLPAYLFGVYLPAQLGETGGSPVRFKLSGNGTEEKPYLIKTDKDLLNFAGAVNGGRSFAGEYIRLEKDIDLSALMAKSPDGLGWKPIAKNYINSFSGNFDGGGYTISNFWIDYDSDPHVGFFGHTTDAVIRNLNLVLAEGRSVKGKLSAGVLMGFQSGEGGLVENVTVTGDVQVVENSTSSPMAGGLIGGSYGTVKNSSASVSVTLWGGNLYHGYAGGFVGLSRGNISHSRADGDVAVYPKEVIDSGETQIALYAGGLTGGFYSSKGTARLENSSASGSVTVESEYVHHRLNAGGLSGYVAEEGVGDTVVQDCYATGDVFVYGVEIRIAGGLIGAMNGGKVDYCYAAGSVNADGGGFSAGGLIGHLSSGQIEHSYYDSDSTGRPYAYFSGRLSDFFDECPMKRSASEMRKQETFKGWDFENVWTMPQGGGRPELR